MMRSMTARCGAAVAFVALVAGCGSGRAASPLQGSTNPTACAVVTSADAANVLGSVTRDTGLAPHPWLCFYETTRLPLATATAGLQVAKPAYLVRVFRDMRTGKGKFVSVPPGRFTPPTLQVITGVGDEALWDSVNLYVRSGRWMLTVTAKAGKIGNTPNLAKSITLARLGLARLPQSG